ncbi:MAG: nucleoside monophosphate kinase [Legionella sp.]|uniref:nucleoside monophosphate kinase n=1 Tax=Legionella sp. TaxID=459 RepID=UPI002850B0E1|nr:nucleoside monophosphate kinase [Legionella sp.]
MNIVLLAGAPGSGKSTQGTALMKMNANIKHLSLGEVVREILKNPQHPITSKYQDLIRSGNLLPDEVIFEILENELEQFKEQNCIILLDGYPRTVAQYEQFKVRWGVPSGLVHLDVDEESLIERMQHRNGTRSDDNVEAITRRLNFYRQTTRPLLDTIKKELREKAITVDTNESIDTTSLYLYIQLQQIAEVHEVLNLKLDNKPSTSTVDPSIKPVWAYSVCSQLWHSGSAYSAIAEVQDSYGTQNFSFSMLGNKVAYLETPDEVKAVLEARSDLGPVYRHFSLAAGLKKDFVATGNQDANSYHLPQNQVNIWKLIHNALNNSVKSDHTRIENLIDKHLDTTFFAEKTFDLDTTFDHFFCSFWSEYLFGTKVSVARYMENREQLLTAMKHCFYNNHYKGLDPTGLSSYFYSYGVREEIKQAKETIKGFMSKSTPGSLVQRFKIELERINEAEKLGLDEKILEEILADNVFDLIFEPDFLENVMYEALVAAVKENADLHEPQARNYVYSQGIKQGFLFPIRSRVLEEPVTLADGTVLPEGSAVFLNLKKSGLYHSTGARRCVGQAFTHYFKEHFFDRLQPIAFKVKQISHPVERCGNENVPMSPERYQVSWHLKRDEAMGHLPAHDYKGNAFFDVLSLHQQTGLNSQMVRHCMLKIRRFMEKNNLDLNNMAIVTPEVRGVPIAAQVAHQLNLPLYIIRKKGGYKMADHEVYRESYDKGYGDPDTVELPVAKVNELAGKTVVFIDDGIASGKSAMACINLLENHGDSEKKAAKVPMVLAILKHDYTPVIPALSQHSLVKTLFDCKSRKMGQVDVPEVQCTESSVVNV